MARELDDAILSMRTNELDIGTWLLQDVGRCGASCSPSDAMLAEHCGPLVRARDDRLHRAARCRALDVSSRTLFALIEEGSCFAGTLLELALACDRSYMLALPDAPDRAPTIVVGEMNFGVYPMATEPVAPRHAASTTRCRRSTRCGP